MINNKITKNSKYIFNSLTINDIILLVHILYINRQLIYL
jgi:hypothetical protein